ncbi:MAG: 3-methyl-2-oxobutanoate dehydrogenase subunit VorB [Candidatus Thermoplasmatota archaeon]|jgi:pyruvate/2-oxoacid:ferredoxin oxidoreductase alpha subunit|nr:3-methyl-2-oxobutanoate dehydrogenase subunit VorB [Candidatus Thermoplasmatota archaeon]
MKQFEKWNACIAKAALLAGCTHYYGYPITPSSEIIHTVAELFPEVGAIFLQASSEVAAINMVYGASAAGKRVLTSSSGPGISLKQEGVSYLAASELPCVIADIQRAGPGLGNIWPSQADYFQVVKGGGHGNYRTPVFAPNSPQEMVDFTIEAFEVADRYRTPVYVFADAYVGQVMESVDFPTTIRKIPEKPWALKGNKETKGNLITSILMSPELEEELNIKLQEKYREIEEKEQRYSEYMVEDADIILMAYGITSRIAQSCVDILRDKGVKAGLFRPITLWPFPNDRLKELRTKTKQFVVFELSNGQMVDDVRLVVKDHAKVDFYGRMGGVIPTPDELVLKVEEFFNKM